jgi:hypothetical protein
MCELGEKQKKCTLAFFFFCLFLFLMRGEREKREGKKREGGERGERRWDEELFRGLLSHL